MSRPHKAPKLILKFSDFACVLCDHHHYVPPFPLPVARCSASCVNGVSRLLLFFTISRRKSLCIAGHSSLWWGYGHNRGRLHRLRLVPEKRTEALHSEDTHSNQGVL